MQMLHDALSPERLEEFQKMQRLVLSEKLNPFDPTETIEVAAEKLADALRAKRDRDDEDADRRAFANRHERRKAEAMDRSL